MSFDPRAHLATLVPAELKARVDRLEAKLHRLEDRLDDLRAAEATLAVHVGAEVCYVNVRRGTATVGDTPAAAPVCAIHVDAALLQRATSGQLGAAGPVLGARALAKLRGLRGTVAFELSDVPGWNLRVVLGGGVPAPAPQLRIILRAADARALASGEIDAQSAFFAGKIKLDGDAALAMQLGGLLA